MSGMTRHFSNNLGVVRQELFSEGSAQGDGEETVQHR